MLTLPINFVKVQMKSISKFQQKILRESHLFGHDFIIMMNLIHILCVMLHLNKKLVIYFK